MNKRDKLEKTMQSKKDKIIKKLGKGAKAAAVVVAKTVVVLALAIVTGCATQPSRSQNWKNSGTINMGVPPVIILATGGCYVAPQTNGGPVIAAAPVGGSSYGDIFCQAMMIENSGTETTSPQHTISPTTTIDVPIGDGLSAGTDAAAKLVAKGVSSLVDDGAVEAVAKEAASAACKTGTCPNK